MSLPKPPLLLVTDRRQARGGLEAVVGAALRGGCRWISLREKDLLPEERRALLAVLAPLARAADAKLTVHDDLAAAATADGVHLPGGAAPGVARRRLGPAALIGLSAHDLAGAARAAADGADYVTLSPIFPSASKPGYGPCLGLAALAEAKRAVAAPVVALGGITAGNAADCLAAGAAAVAVMGGIMAAADPEAATRGFIEAIGAAPVG